MSQFFHKRLPTLAKPFEESTAMYTDLSDAYQPSPRVLREKPFFQRRMHDEKPASGTRQPLPADWDKRDPDQQLRETGEW